MSKVETDNAATPRPRGRKRAVALWVLAVALVVGWVDSAHHLTLAGAAYTRFPALHLCREYVVDALIWRGQLEFILSGGLSDLRSLPVSVAEVRATALDGFHGGLQRSHQPHESPGDPRWLASARTLGFTFLAHRETPTPADASDRRVLRVGIPIWLPLGVTLIALWRRHARRRRWRRRVAAGCCTACGYDVRGIADRCPECGATLATAG